MTAVNDIEQKIVGGMFGLEGVVYRNQNASLPDFDSSRFLLANARSGIAILTHSLAPSQIWFPSYLCDVMLKAAKQWRSNPVIQFYDVSYRLEISTAKWLTNVKKGDLVVLIDYFGFPYDRVYAIQAKERGAWVLEDACQALLSEGIGDFADFMLYSPRKWIGVPDGGILVDNTDMGLLDIELHKPPSEWWLKAFYATILRREFDLIGGDRRWFHLFREADINGPIGPYAMSELTQLLMQHGFDYHTIAQKRVENYKTLLNDLDKFALFPELPNGVVPLGFPIRLKNRDHVRQILFEHNIYPPVHWAIHDVVPAEFTESHRLADDMMTLLCDQRYDSNDMERIAEIILKEARL